MDSIADYQRASATASAPSPPAEDLLTALANVRGVRADLDRLERDLIGAAREAGVSWVAIAAALGVGTRQAAEQRWLRLRGDRSRDPAPVRAAQRRQRSVDGESGQAIVALRRAAAETHRLIEADAAWDGRHPRAALARTSLAAAVAAAPSALYALCRNVIEDLDQIGNRHLPAGVAAAVRRLRAAEREARTAG